MLREQNNELVSPLFEPEDDTGVVELGTLLFGSSLSIDDIKKIPADKFTAGFPDFAGRMMGDVGLSFDSIEVLGTVEEGDQRHVVTRIGIGAGELALTQLEVVTLVPFGSEWRMALTGETRGIAATLRSAF